MVKKESKARERATLRINDMDHCLARYGERTNGHRGAADTEMIEKEESFFSFPPYLCGSVGYI
jgi:hypothetical protein